MEKIIKTSKWRTLVWISAKHTVKVLVEEMYVVKTGCLAFGCHSLGVSSPMVACSGYTWHTTGFFSHRSSSCSHGLRNGFCHSMAHPWAGRPFWAGSSLVWPSWPSWPSCFSGPSWALSSLAWFLPWPSWSSWYWWLPLAWLTPLVVGAYTCWLILGTRWLIENIKFIYFFASLEALCAHMKALCAQDKGTVVGSTWCSWKNNNTKFTVCMQHL